MEGLILIEPDVYRDDRGFFSETYNRARYREAGIAIDLVQDNQSRSVRGTVRGLHYQHSPGQAKLVAVAHGGVLDVVVDLRAGSATHLKWEAFLLDDQTMRQLYIPVGFAHGYCALTAEVDFTYKVSSYYDAAMERGIAWNDPDIAVEWSVERPIVSDRDRQLPLLREVLPSLPEWR